MYYIKMGIIAFIYLMPSYMCSQSVGYSFGISLPNEISNTSSNANPYQYQKDLGYTFSLALSNSDNLFDKIKLRLSTYKSHLEYTTFGAEGVPIITNISTQYYFMELQSYLFGIKIKNILDLYFGVNSSYLFRSAVDWQVQDFTRTLPTEIDDSNFEKTRWRSTTLAKASTEIKLNNDISVVPSYTLTFAFASDFSGYQIRPTQINHIFEVMIKSRLHPKNNNK